MNSFNTIRQLYELLYNHAILFSFSDPKFKEPITNVTAPVGREAILSCVVQDLAGYKVIHNFLKLYISAHRFLS